MSIKNYNTLSLRIAGYNVPISTDSKDKIITNVDTTPANIPSHDRMIPLIDEQVDNHNLKINEVSADSEYSAGHVRETLEKRSINAYIPLYDRGGKHRADMFGYEDFKYDKERDIVVCPSDKVMYLMQKRSMGKFARIYRSRKKDCKNCPSLTKCTTSNIHIELLR